jgi:enoyl-CoA hydratase
LHHPATGTLFCSFFLIFPRAFSNIHPKEHHMENIILETEGQIAVITINRPDKLNALSHDTFVEIKAAVLEANAQEDVRVIIITGAGEKAFVAGADINELSVQNPISGREYSLFGQDVFTVIEQSAKPVIAAVNGFALGGGCELALSCHIRIAAENAKFGQPEVNLGIIPGYGGTQRLARIIGFGRAAELLITGAIIDANEAYRIGLANRLAAKGGALSAAKEMAALIISKAPPAVGFALNAIRAVHQMNLQEGLATEAALFGLCCGTDDFREGTTAFLEKRSAQFTGK